MFLVLKKNWTEFGKHKNWRLPNFNNNSPKFCQITKIWRTNRLAKHWSLSKQTSNQTLKKFNFVHEENRMANNIHVSVETIQAREFEKPQPTFRPSFSTKTIVFQSKQFKTKCSSKFYFASFHCLKALTGCLEKLEIFAKRYELKTFWTRPVLRLECLVCHWTFIHRRQFNFWSNNGLIWYAFLFRAKNYSSWSKAILLQFFLGSIQLTNDCPQTGWLRGYAVGL